MRAQARSQGRGSRIAIIAVLLLGLLIFAGVYFAWNTVTDIFQPVASGSGVKTVNFQVKAGETTQDIANELQKDGLIHSALAFRIWSRIKGLDTKLEAGGFILNTGMSISDIIDNLLNPLVKQLVVAVPPGLRLEQIAQKLAAAKLPGFTASDFLKYTRRPEQFPDKATYPILACIPAGDSMEGLLFPDTYFTPVDKGDARYMVNKMLGEFQSMVQTYHLDTMAQKNLPPAPGTTLKAGCSRQLYSIYQMAILGSLVEREVVFDADRAGVAGVYWDRIYIRGNETAGYLGSDPSVEYARDSQPGTTIFWKDLNDKGVNIAPSSPWNTYTHQYWPPTAICSPSLADLQAAANPPQNTGNLYFLGKKDGHVVYAKNYTQFLQEQQQYLGS